MLSAILAFYGLVIFITILAAFVYGTIQAIWYYTKAPKFPCPSCGHTLRQRTFKPRRQKCSRCKALVQYDYRDQQWKVVEPVRLVIR